MKVTGHFGSLNRVGGKEDIKPVLPAFTTTTLDNVTVFETFSQTIPITYSKNGPLSNVYLSHGTSLPSWATLTWTGADTGGSVTITGTPSQLSMIGTTNFKITAVNKFGMTEQAYSLTVDVGQYPLWNTTSLPSVVVFDYYNPTITLTVPTLTHPGPLTSVVVKSGSSLPNWATLSWSGTNVNIVGTPPSLAALGTTNFTLTATNRYGNTDQAFSINVNDGLVPVWATTSLPNIVVYDAYNAIMNITVPTGIDAGPLTNVTVSSGSLPSWATLSHDTVSATISGIPPNLAALTTTNFTLTATNRYGSTPQAFSITVDDGVLPIWATTSLSNITISNSTSIQTMNVTVPTGVDAGPLTGATVTSGALPTWATLSTTSNTVVISGTPNNTSYVGTSTFTLSATNRYGSTAQAFTLGVVNSSAPAWLASSLPTAGTYVAYNQTIQVSCSVALTSVTTKSGSLPTGISYALSGNSVVFSGTATAAASSSITLTANTGTYHIDQALSLTVSAPSGNQFYNSAGTYTFTVPANVGQIRSLAVGGGGSGAPAAGCAFAGYWSGGGGGGSGNESQAVFTVTPGQQISITVGTHDQNSTVGSYLTGGAGGGGGGLYGLFGGGGGSGGGSAARCKDGPGVGGGSGGSGGSSGSAGGDCGQGGPYGGGGGGGLQKININGSISGGSGTPACVFKSLSGIGFPGGGSGTGNMGGGGGGGITILGQNGSGGSSGKGGNNSSGGGGGGGGFGGGGGGGSCNPASNGTGNAGGNGGNGCVYLEWG